MLVCCSVLQRVAVCCSVSHREGMSQLNKSNHISAHESCHVFTSRWGTGWRRLTGGGNLKVQVIFAKEPLSIGLFCGKQPVKIRHPMGLRHSVCVVCKRLVMREHGTSYLNESSYVFTSGCCMCSVNTETMWHASSIYNIPHESCCVFTCLIAEAL